MTKSLSFQFYGAEYSVVKDGAGYQVTEYREVRAFRGYRTVKIKPIVVPDLKAFFAAKYGEDWRNCCAATSTGVYAI